MNDKLRCEFFHQFDGKCCSDEDRCLYHCDQRVRVIPLDPPIVNNAVMVIGTATMFCALAVVCGLIGLYTAIQMDSHYAERDRIDQEISWQYAAR